MTIVETHGADKPSIDDEPEIAFDHDWSQLVKAGRKRAKLNQDDLAGEVGCSQAMISYIENVEPGETKSSKAVLRIVSRLGIALPRILFATDEERRWVTAGVILRGTNPDGFRAMLTSAEQLIIAGRPKTGH